MTLAPPPPIAPTPTRFLVLALYGYAVFGWELVVVLLLDPVLGASLGSSGAALAHWGLTAAGWAAGAVLVGRAASAPPGVFAPSPRPAIPGWGRGAVVALALGIAVGVRILALGEWKPAAEYAGLQAAHGGAAALAAAALLLYSLAETAVILLVIACAQRAGELRFGGPLAPWGGLALAATWGATHVLLQGPAAGLYAVCAALLYGVAFAWGPRRAVASFALIAAAFLL